MLYITQNMSKPLSQLQKIKVKVIIKQLNIFPDLFNSHCSVKQPSCIVYWEQMLRK